MQTIFNKIYPILFQATVEIAWPRDVNFVFIQGAFLCNVKTRLSRHYAYTCCPVSHDVPQGQRCPVNTLILVVLSHMMYLRTTLSRQYAYTCPASHDVPQGQRCPVNTLILVVLPHMMYLKDNWEITIFHVMRSL